MLIARQKVFYDWPGLGHLLTHGAGGVETSKMSGTGIDRRNSVFQDYGHRKEWQLSVEE